MIAFLIAAGWIVGLTIVGYVILRIIFYDPDKYKL